MSKTSLENRASDRQKQSSIYRPEGRSRRAKRNGQGTQESVQEHRNKARFQKPVKNTGKKSFQKQPAGWISPC